MGTTNTKSIAARLPFDEYINIITKASELRLTTSDYIILKLYEVGRLPQLEQELSTTQATMITLRSELDKTKNLVSSQETTLAQWQAHAQALETTIKTGQEELTMVKGDLASLIQKVGEATTKEKLLQKKIANLVASDADWERHALSLSETCDSLEAQQRAETTRLNKHIAEQNALLSSQNAEVNRLAAELVEVKASLAAAATRHRDEAATAKALVDSFQTELASVKERALTMYEALVEEHDRSRVHIIPKAYWPFIEGFMDSLDEKQP